MNVTHLEVQNMVKQMGAAGQLRLSLARPGSQNQYRPSQFSKVKIWKRVLLLLLARCLGARPACSRRIQGTLRPPSVKATSQLGPGFFLRIVK